MARAPYGPHTVTQRLVVMGMVVGSPKTARATPLTTRARVGWPWFPHCATRTEFPIRRRISALCAHITPVVPVPPPLEWALPQYPLAGGGSAPCAP
jgi:hypothetical protein